jgi:hypothetical protein
MMRLLLLGPPRVALLISRTLKIHSGQTLTLGRYSVIRLNAGAARIMLTNDDHAAGNQRIAVEGGIWNMNNLNQPLTVCQKDRTHRPYTPGT